MNGDTQDEFSAPAPEDASGVRTPGNDELFRKIFDQPIAVDWQYDGPITLHVADQQLEGNTSSFVHIVGGEARGRVDVPGHRFVGEQQGSTGYADLGGAGIVERAFCTFGGLTIEPSETSYNLYVEHLAVGQDQPESAATRELILGLSFDGRPFSPSWHTRIFGRDALVSGYASEAHGGADAVQVIYAGPPVSELERASIWDLIKILCGDRGGSWFLETFDASGAILGWRYANRGETPRRGATRPVNMIQGAYGLRTICGQFHEMLDTMADLQARVGVRLGAALHHYQDGSVSRYAPSRLRDFSVALDAFIAMLLERRPQGFDIAEPARFADQIRPVVAAFRNAFAGDPAFERLQNNLRGINKTSPRAEMDAVLARLNIGYAATERNTIRAYRNGVLHEGYYGDEDSPKIFERNVQAAALLANLFNRALLKRLGYDGPYMDASHPNNEYPLDRTPDYPLLADR